MSNKIQYAVPSITKDEHSRFPSTWKPPIGKKLTNARIAFYQRQGYYGSGLMLPPLQRPACIATGCTSRETRFSRQSYLPCSGHYCERCRHAFRDEHKRQIETEREMQERMEEARKDLYQ